MASDNFYKKKERSIPVETLKIFIDNTTRSICRLSSKIGQGSAGLIVTKHNGSDYYFLITCNHVLPFTARDDLCEVEMFFEGLEKLKDNIKKKWVQFCWSSVKLDATVIELTQDFVQYLNVKGATFLKPYFDEIKINQEIGMLQYPEGVFSFSYGVIYIIKNGNVFYWVDGAQGSSGSPVMAYDGSVLAVHNSQILEGPNVSVDHKMQQNRESRGGAILSVILRSYFKDRDFVPSSTTNDHESDDTEMDTDTGDHGCPDPHTAHIAEKGNLVPSRLVEPREPVVITEGSRLESFEASRSAPQSLSPQRLPGKIQWSFSLTKKTTGLQLSKDNRTATHAGSATGWQIAVCEPCTEANFFTVRIEKNPRHRDLHIGFTLRAEALQDMTRAAHNSWQVGTGNQQLYERGLSGPCGRRRIDEGAVISVEKDRSKCALRFYVDGEELQDKNERPYGWRPTGLTAQDFDALVGCVWLWYSGDEVCIVPEPEKMNRSN